MTTDRPESTEITCPQCSNISEIREGVDTFCPTCDYPLFWADPDQTTQRRAVQSAAVGEEASTGESEDGEDHEHTADDDDLDAEASDIICRNCALRNPGNRTYCTRCGHELPPPDEWFNPDEPVQLEPVVQTPLWRALLVPFAVLIVIAGVTLLALRIADRGPFAATESDTNVKVVVRNSGNNEMIGEDTAITFQGLPGEAVRPVIAYRNIGTDAKGQQALDSLSRVACDDLECSIQTEPTASIDDQGRAAEHIAMDVISTGPIIFYTQATTNSLIAVECGSRECTNFGARRFFVVEDGDKEGPQIGINPAVWVTGGVPVLTYSDSSGVIRVAHICGDACPGNDGVEVTNLNKVKSSLEFTTSVDSETSRQSELAIAIPRTGAPYLAFTAKDPTGRLRIVQCDSPTCMDPKALLTDFSDSRINGIEPQIAMVIDKENLVPIIAYVESKKPDPQPTEFLTLLICKDEKCGNPSLRRVVNQDIGNSISMEHSASGRLVIAYRNEAENGSAKNSETNGALWIAICETSSCEDGRITKHRVDDGDKTEVGYNISMLIDKETAVIAYTDKDRTQLRVARVDVNKVLTQKVKLSNTGIGTDIYTTCEDQKVSDCANPS